MTRGRGALAVVVSCEHAANAVPRALRLGVPRALLASHRGWDPGALPIATALARALQAPRFAGRWSRLVADLNRSEHHAHLARRSADGVPIPGNRLGQAARAERVARYWAPYRHEVEAAITALARRQRVLHLSVHSFTPALHGVVRTNDVGLLHDPARPREVALCLALQRALAASGLRVRRNFPYFGNTDAFVTHLRSRLPAARYLGLELECNQRLARTAAGQRRLASALAAALREVLDR